MAKARPLVLVAAMMVAGAAAFAQTVGFGHSHVEVVTASGREGLEVELASSPEQLAQGLMFRKALDPKTGMLFDFGRPQPVAMWMKNTLIPLDMVFIGADGLVVDVAEYTVPQSLTPIGPATPVRAVLELNAGTAKRLGLKTGDRVVHPMFAKAGG